MLRREMTLGRVGSGGSGGPIRVARVCPPGVACVPLVSRLSLARRPVSFSRIEGHAHLRLGGHGAECVILVERYSTCRTASSTTEGEDPTLVAQGRDGQALRRG